MAQKDPLERYRQLAAKWLDGTITPEEEAEWQAWYHQQEDTPLEVPPTFAQSREAHRARLLENIQQEITPVVPMRSRIKRFTTAAAAILIIGTTAWYLTSRPDIPAAPATAQTAQQQSDLQPGTNGAVLQLADGRTIVLDTAGNGALTNGIRKEKDNLIVQAEIKSAEAAYNLLTTPRARQQQLVLPDGTRIWLNAESSLRFPAAFTGNIREVEITGEAYFEVAKDAARPFKVKIGENTVEVLGTHFNIMAYANEPAMQTTLLEGSVKVSNKNRSLLLKPGQQSRSTSNEALQLITDADTEMAIAWKNGVQVFKNTSLMAIMRQVERWYDVQVKYEGAKPDAITFSGEVPRGVTLTEILRVLESENCHFKIDATLRTVTVTP